MALPIPVDVEPFVTALRRRETYLGYAREAMSLARCAARYPLGVFDRTVAASSPSGSAIHDVPVLLVHGFGHNSSGWFVLRQHLRDAGFTSVHTWNYDPWRNDIPELAEMLSDRVDMLRGVTGADRVHIVGHSLGGIVLRWYVQELGGADKVADAITVASPHAGTRLATFIPGRTGRIASQLTPGSWLLQRLAAGECRSAVRWTAFYSNLDALVMPPSSAMLPESAMGATNVLVKDVGHLSIMLSSRLARGIVDVLETSAVVEAAS